MPCKKQMIKIKPDYDGMQVGRRRKLESTGKYVKVGYLPCYDVS